METLAGSPAESYNFPRQLTPFFGRERELQEIAALLADEDCRLLTLTGPGGTGKTRLAIAAAEEAVRSQALNAAYINLQPLSDGNSISTAIAEALRLPLSGPDDPAVQLICALEKRQLLLVLDNFEHLVDSAGLLTWILESAPEIKCLVTSREVLNLAEEWLYPVQGLPYPTGNESSSRAVDGPGPSGERYAAVLLFAERARRLRRDFAVENEMEGILRICRLVEGLPLALELAASWTKSLSCAAIADELQNGLHFLDSGPRNLPERHRSLQAVFAGSWSRLSEAERSAFMRLSVFRGRFQREAAAAVAGASLANLSSLVDKSLLRREPDGSYAVHELLRQWGAERLAEIPADEERTLEQRCAYYAGFLAGRAEGIRDSRQRGVTLEVEAELKNIRAAWRWAARHGKLEALEKSAFTLYHFHDTQSRYLEGAELLEGAERDLEESVAAGSMAQSDGYKLLRAQLLVFKAWLMIRLGKFEPARAALEESRGIYQALGRTPPPGLGTDPLPALALLASIGGDYTLAERLGRQALREIGPRQDPENEVIGLYTLASILLAQGKYGEAQEQAEQGYALAERLGNRWFIAYLLLQLGDVARLTGDFAQARQYYGSCYSIREYFDDPEGMAIALCYLGQSALLAGEVMEAGSLYGRALEIYTQISDRGGLARAYHGAAKVALAGRNYAEARRNLKEALATAGSIRFTSLALAIFVTAGELLLQTGQSVLGLELLALAQDHPASEVETKELAHQALASARGRPESTPPESPPKSLELAIERLLEQLDAGVEGAPGLLEDRAAAKRRGPLIEPLTGREQEVLDLLAAGRTNEEIAAELFLSVGTVKWYTGQIYSKLAVAKRTQAVARARELGLIR